MLHTSCSRSSRSTHAASEGLVVQDVVVCRTGTGGDGNGRGILGRDGGKEWNGGGCLAGRKYV